MSSMADTNAHPASYRDPAGFIFTSNGVLYRQVNQSYAKQYEQLMTSGLYERLTTEGHLIPHTEVSAASPSPSVSAASPSPSVSASPSTAPPGHFITLLPQQLARLSYPAEWCPDQLKDAALLTLQIQLLAMDNDMTLKDATPYNIQFDKSRPIFIDTLSFEHYEHSKPWIAYRQFCECFLFPLYLHRYTKTGTHKFAAAWPDGIPASETTALLPFRSRLNSGVWLHVHLHNKIGAASKDRTRQTTAQFSKPKLTRLIQHLHSIIGNILPTSIPPSPWNNYYNETILGQAYLEAKRSLFRRYLEDLEFASALDLGCNDGLFSKILAEKGKPVIAVDSDWQCVRQLYRDRNPHILPLCIDLSNPTPPTGFRNAERASFTARAASDLVTALALVHHLALHHNIPLPLIAGYFSSLTTKYLLIEFIPLSDPKAEQLIARKETPPADYGRTQFEAAFGPLFNIERTDLIPGTERQLYLMTKR
jgi:hypothetical protein